MTRESNNSEVITAPGLHLPKDGNLCDSWVFTEELDDLSLWVRPFKITDADASVQRRSGRSDLFLQVRKQIIKAIKVSLIEVPMGFQQFNSLGCFILLVKNTSEIFYCAW